MLDYGPKIGPDTLVQDLLNQYPQTGAVFIAHHALCVGCPVSAFHTLAEVAAVYKVDIHALLAELHNAIRLGQTKR